MRFKHFIHYAIAGSAALAIFFCVALPASAQVAVTLNGDPVDFSPTPIIQDGRVFVPLRGVFQRLGASVVYTDRTITATGDKSTILLRIGSTQAIINGQPQVVDVAPFILGSSTYVPLRFVSQALGAGVAWDNTNRIVSIETSGGFRNHHNDMHADDAYADYPPPAIPNYDQPDVPASSDIWQPGYWAWGAYGYYWVPGTWVDAPQPGYSWTPGYWGWDNGHYVWTEGYWATTVGFYGGVNYGWGYYGNGYVGGRWENNEYRYNTAVSRVNTTTVQNVYVDRTVYVNNSTAPHVSYNGGPRGLTVRPTQEDVAAAKAPHIAMTPVQRQHVLAAAQDRRLLASVNHNQPPILTVTRPFSANNLPAGLVPVKASDRVNVNAKAPAHPVPAIPAAPVHAAPAVHLPATRTAPPAIPTLPAHAAPAVHVPAIRTLPPVLPTSPPRAARAVHAPAARTAPPVLPTPPPHVAPAVHAPAVHAPAARTAPPVLPTPPQHVVPTLAPAVHAAPSHGPAKPKPTPRPSPHGPEETPSP